MVYTVIDTLNVHNRVLPVTLHVWFLNPRIVVRAAWILHRQGCPERDINKQPSSAYVSNKINLSPTLSIHIYISYCPWDSPALNWVHLFPQCSPQPLPFLSLSGLQQPPQRLALMPKLPSALLSWAVRSVHIYQLGLMSNNIQVITSFTGGDKSRVVVGSRSDQSLFHLPF